MIFLFIIFTCLFIWLAWKNLEWATLALVFLLPSYLIRFSIAGLPLTLLEIMILVVFAVWFIKNQGWLLGRWKQILGHSEEAPVRTYPFAWPLAVWLIVSLIAVGVAGWKLSSFGIWRAYFFEPALLYIVIVNVFSTKEKLKRLIAAFGLSAAVVAIFAAVQYATGKFIPNEFWAAADGRRATSFFQYPNAVGLYVAPIAFLLLGTLASIMARGKSLFKRRFEAVTWAIGIATCFLAVVLARSEGAAFASAVCLVVFGLCAGRTVRRTTIGLLAFVFFIIISAAPLRDYVTDRITLANFSGQVRRAQWHETWNMLKDGRLLAGAGLDNYQSSVKPYHQEGIFVKNDDPDFQRKVVFNAEYRAKVWQPLEIYLYPHNIFLNFWSELGVAGLLVFVLIVAMFFCYGIASFIRLKKNNDPFAYVVLGLMMALLASLIHGLVDVPYFKNDLAAMFWIMMGMMSVTLYLSRTKQ